jgi:hypothetical protein
MSRKYREIRDELFCLISEREIINQKIKNVEEELVAAADRGEDIAYEVKRED